MNLVDMVDILSEFEKAFIVRRLNALDDKMNVHLGTLPFVNLELVVKALHFLPASSKNPEADLRKGKAILEKLKPRGIGFATTRFQIRLNDEKVCKRSSGKNMTNRVVRLPFTKKVEAGIRWNHFKRKYEKPETDVNELALLTRLQPGVWVIECKKSLADATKQYLFDRFGVTGTKW